MGQNPPYRPICEGVDEITVSNITDESGWIKIYGKNADTLILGDATHEGGNITVYRDTSSNTQLSLDTDAASNAKALDVYGGVVAQNYLTVGQTTLNTGYVFYVAGTGYILNDFYCGGNIFSSPTGGFKAGSDGVYTRVENASVLPLNVLVTGTDSTNHSIILQIDGNTIIEVKATGDGAGGITNPAIGLYGGTPATQAAAISDPAESIAGNNAAIDSILAALRAISLIAT